MIKALIKFLKENIMGRIVTAEQAALEMVNVTGSVHDNVFLLDDLGAIIIHSNNDGGNQADACAVLSYEIIDENEIAEFKNNNYLF